MICLLCCGHIITIRVYAQRLHLEAVVQLKAFFFYALVLFSCAFILFSKVLI